MLPLNDFITQIRGSLITEQYDTPIQGVSIDSRTVQPGECFFAIRGTRFDGHSFIREAHAKGAVACVIDYIFLSNLLDVDDDDVANKIKSIHNIIRGINFNPRAMAGLKTPKKPTLLTMIFT